MYMGMEPERQLNSRHMSTAALIGGNMSQIRTVCQVPRLCVEVGLSFMERTGGARWLSFKLGLGNGGGESSY